METNFVKILDPPSELFSPHCDSRFDCKRNHCSSKTAVNRSVSLQFVYFSLSESLVNYGLESDLSMCMLLLDSNYEKNIHVYTSLLKYKLIQAIREHYVRRRETESSVLEPSPKVLISSTTKYHFKRSL